MVAGAGLELVGVGLGLFTGPLATLSAIPLPRDRGWDRPDRRGPRGPSHPIVYHKQIANWIDGKAPGIGDALFKLTTPSEWGSWSNEGNAKRNWLSAAGYAPPPKGQGHHDQHQRQHRRPQGRFRGKQVNLADAAPLAIQRRSNHADGRSLPAIAGAPGNW